MALSEEVYRVQDWNNDGVPDRVAPHSIRSEGVDVEEGTLFGSYPPPGLLTKVTLETGAETTLSYTSSTFMYPSGVSTWPNPDGVIYHDSHVARDLVTEVEVLDPITGEGSRQEFEYAHAYCESGVCQGFGERTVRNFKISPRFEDTINRDWVQLSESTTEYLLSRDYMVPVVTEVYTDHERAHLPLGSVWGDMALTRWSLNEYAQDPNDYSADPVPNLWLSGRSIQEYAEQGGGLDFVSWDIQVARNAVGLPTDVVHLPVFPYAPEDRIRNLTSWIANPEGSLYVPSTQSTIAWDANSAAYVTVEEGHFAYDDQGVGQSTVAEGLLTHQEVCAGELATGLCDSTLEWFFERTARGTVSRSYGVDDTTLFDERIVTGFGFGETIPAVELNGEGHTVTRTWDLLGQVTTETDPNGVVSIQAFDSFGRSHRQSRIAADSALPDLLSEQLYDDTFDTSPRGVSTTTYSKDLLGATIPRKSHEILDGFGDVIQAWQPNEDGTGFIVVDSVKDAFGNTVTVSVPRTVAGPFDASALSLSTNYASKAYFDAYNQAVWSKSDVTIKALTTNPAAGVTRSIEGGSYRKEVEHDTHGRVKEVRMAYGANGAYTVTGHYTYDGRGRIATFTDGNNNVHRYSWDGVGRLRDVYRDGGSGETPYFSYSYEGPYVAEAREGDGTVASTWEYDSLGRTTLKRVYGKRVMGNVPDEYRWIWDTLTDADGTRTWNGVRHQIEDPEGLTRYFYDEAAPFGTLGRLSSVERSNQADPALIFSYDYDFEGRTLLKTTPTKQWVSSTYSDTGWKLSDDVGSAAAGLTETVSYTYGDMGIMDGWRLLDHASGGYWDASMERTSPNQLSALEYTHVDRPADSVRVDYGYTSAGWLASKAISPLFGTGDRLEYTYDKLRRVKNVRYTDLNNNRDRYEYYVYDDGGNLTRFVEGHDAGLYQWNYTPPTQFGEIPERVEPAKGWSDTHTWHPVTGRMTGWTTNDAMGVRERRFEYDGAGRLVTIQNNGVWTNLSYDVDDNVIYEVRGGDVYRRFEGYRSGPDGAIESVLPMLRVEVQDLNGLEIREPRVVMLDQDGHALYTWETTGDELSREITGAYGMPMHGADWDSGPNWEIDGLHGSEEDRTNQVVHFGARHTLFRDGMWMQPEPLLAIGRLNPLLPGTAWPIYAAGNPINRADPSGFADVQYFTNDDSSAWARAADGFASTLVDPATAFGAQVMTGKVTAGDFMMAALSGLKHDIELSAMTAAFIYRNPGMAREVVPQAMNAQDYGRIAGEATLGAVLTKAGLRGRAPKNAAVAKVHGNSKASMKPQHGYEISRVDGGDVGKTGISGRSLNKNGTSPRANQQVNKLNREAGGEVWKAEVVETNMPGRAAGLAWEQGNVDRLYDAGNSMDLHSRPKPSGQ